LKICKKEAIQPDFFAGDFELCPDIAQTFAVVLTAKNIPFTLKGLSTLKVKETDRVQALINELAKIGIQLKAEYVEGDILLHYYEDQEIDLTYPPEFSSYHDHRMALAFSLLSLIAPVIIEDPQVVQKSFPDFWEEMNRLGMEIQVIK
jgi:3-phosphoshikimate 1-carboxyvinyltransferase